MEKDAFKTNFYIAKIIINDWDPLSLLSCGAPGDVYDVVVTQILRAAGRVFNHEELAAEIQVIFAKAFNWQLSMEECEPVAGKIWSIPQSSL